MGHVPVRKLLVYQAGYIPWKYPIESHFQIPWKITKKIPGRVFMVVQVAGNEHQDPFFDLEPPGRIKKGGQPTCDSWWI